MKRIAICLGLAFALLSCSPPPFDLGISTSAKTAKKLTLVGQVTRSTPIRSTSAHGSGGNEDVVFIPEKDGTGGITIQAGFVYSIDPTSGQQVSFIVRHRRAGKLRSLWQHILPGPGLGRHLSQRNTAIGKEHPQRDQFSI